MRLLTLIVSILFVAIGAWMIVDGDAYGWSVAGFFSFCLLVAIFEPWLRKPRVCEYEFVITEDEVACEHPERKRESIRWADVTRIWYITTADGPRFPDEWLLFEGENDGCSFPTEARGMDGIWDELKQRFAGFDYTPLIAGGTDYAKHLCWERPRPASP